MKSRSFLTGSLLAAVLAAPVAAQTTGSRIKGNTEQPLSIIRFEEPAEIAETRALIARGEYDAAIAMARKLIDQDPAADIQYFGYNALCVAESAAKNWANALAACDRAVGIRPGFWMALNSRGTVHLMDGRAGAAITDYELALSALTDGAPARSIVEHNLALARANAAEPVS